ncbi:hypothetical protein P879_00784 [Paragonimus westermani]|uniref:Ras-related protein Rab-10 n=1 Tax=Paragonimus westermani TaxID=34504 RepID=A0A8T0E097_9TREM|nr:hypothetical protein P879_00784 [Paragonimus westermani]
MAYTFGQTDDMVELAVPDVRQLALSTTYPQTNTSNGVPKYQNRGPSTMPNTAPAKMTSKGRSQNVHTSGNGGGAGEYRFDARYKVLLLGNSGVGKTSILQTLMGEPFNPGTISTIGIDLAKKIFIVENNRIQLEIWDTAGQEQYYSIVALHFREAKAFIVVYDVTDPRTFEQIRKYWLRSVDQHMDEPVPVFFAANKADLSAQRKVTLEEGEKASDDAVPEPNCLSFDIVFLVETPAYTFQRRLASQQCAHGHFETSAKTGLNIINLFQNVAEAMVSTWGAPKRWYEMNSQDDQGNHWPNQVSGRQTVQLTYSAEKPKKRQCCQTK